MNVFAYIFLAEDTELLVPSNEQQLDLQHYARSIGLTISENVVEENVPLQQPFNTRPQGGELLRRCQPGDIILVVRTEWILASALEGKLLLQALADNHVALHCLDLGVNISVPEKRRLLVSEGSAELVRKLLTALSTHEARSHSQNIRRAKRHRRQQGKYLGGPVPFGWEVNSEGYLVENEMQQQIIREIEKMRAAQWSYREISGRLRADYDINLSHEGVRKILFGNHRRHSANGHIAD